MKKFFARLFFISLALFFALSARAGFSAPPAFDYAVTAEILPIRNAPGGAYTVMTKDGIKYVEQKGGAKGVVVYGNKVRLRQAAGGWYALLEPPGSSWIEPKPGEEKILGYIPFDGLEKFPDYEAFDSDGEPRYYMALEDAPELFILPEERGAENELPARGFSLLRGETVPALGKRDGYLLFSFGSVDGSGGVGDRYAWGRADDFVALDDYAPERKKIDRDRIPASRRIYAAPDPDSGVEKLQTTTIDSLAKRGFVIDPAPVISERAVSEYEADFLTTDVFLHAFHLLYEQALQKYEWSYLSPKLEEAMADAIEYLDAIKPRVAAGVPADGVATAREIFSVVLGCLSEEARADMSPAAKAEMEKVFTAAERVKSEITGEIIDYALFRARGRYNNSSARRRYFAAASYLNGAALPLFGENLIPNERNIAAAAAISLALDTSANWTEPWGAYEQTADFFLGLPDGGDPKICRELAREHFGESHDVKRWENFSDEKKLLAFAYDIVKKVPEPAIQTAANFGPATEKNSTRENSGSEHRPPVFRISPGRFAFDAYIMNRLTSPRAGSEKRPRNLPKGSDVMAVLGSEAALGLSKNDFGVKNYERNMVLLRKKFEERPDEKETVHAHWLEAIHASFKNSGAEQFFYRDGGWRWKELAAGLASWAETRRGAVSSYDDQGGAEKGGGNGDWRAGRFAPPAPRGYVEPNHEFFLNLQIAAGAIADFAESYRLEEEGDGEIGPNYAEKFENFASTLAMMSYIARKETYNILLDAEDYAAIKQVARDLDESLRQMACVSDAAADGSGETVLEAAAGTPRKIYVFVDDKSGGARVTKGYVFSYYEFARPVTDRLTGEEWREIVSDPARADELEKLRPDWHVEYEKNTN
jgi:hypothetical protein